MGIVVPPRPPKLPQDPASDPGPGANLGNAISQRISNMEQSMVAAQSSNSGPNSEEDASDETDEDDAESSTDFLPWSSSGVSVSLSPNHPFLEMFQNIVREGVSSFPDWQPQEGQSQQGSKGADGASSSSQDGKRKRESASSGRPGHPTRRRATGAHEDGNDDNDDGSDDDGKRKRKAARSGEGPEAEAGNGHSSRLLACPFYKRDRIQFEGCLRFRLKAVKDVKQHLRRNHQQIQYCPRCGATFDKSRSELNEHLRGVRCDNREFEEPAGVTDDHHTQFTQNVRRAATISEQWYTVWDILFPENTRPDSPFIESPTAEVLDEMMRYWDERGKDLISREIGRRGGPQQFEWAMADYENELSTLFTTVGREVLRQLVTQMLRGQPLYPYGFNRDASQQRESEITGLQSGTERQDQLHGTNMRHTVQQPQGFPGIDNFSIVADMSDASLWDFPTMH